MISSNSRKVLRVSVQSCFVVSFHLKTPVILQQANLAGLLAAVIAARTDSWDRAHSEIPLLRTSKVWHGSDLFFVGPGVRSSAPFVRAVRPGDTLTVDMVAPGRGGKHARIDTVRGPMKNLLNHYPTVSVERVMTYGCGDIDAVQDLLSDVRGIGKKRNSGYGELATTTNGKPWIDVVKIDAPNQKNFGLLSRDGGAARSLPLTLWTSLSSVPPESAPRTTTEMSAWDMPKWLVENVPCAVPVSHTLQAEDIEKAIH
jgi:CRISPR type IV-associated protein Csf3